MLEASEIEVGEGQTLAVPDEVLVPATPGLIDKMEAKILQRAGSEYQAKGEQISFLPLVHRFTPGMYIRQITMPANTVVTTRIHKTEHPYVVSAGKCLVLVEGQGWIPIQAPHSGVTKPGTRRLLLVLEDTVWTTFHTNPDELRDIAEIEDMLMVDYDNPLIADEVAKRAGQFYSIPDGADCEGYLGAGEPT